MPVLACALLAFSPQEPQQGAAAQQAPQSASQDSQDSQDSPAAPAGGLDGLDELEDEWLDFYRENQAGWNVDVSGFLKFAGVASNTRRVVSNSDRLRSASLTAARMWIDAEIEGWRLRVGIRGEQHSGLGYLGLSGRVDDARIFELVASREINEHLRIQAGRIRSPFLQSALYDDNQLLFFERSFLGEDWDQFTNGVALNARLGDLEAWLGVQNGEDNFGNNVAITARALWHVTGDRGGMHVNEGPFDAPEGLAMTVGGAAYLDTEDDDFSTQAAEAYISFRPVFASAEVVDQGEGLGDLFSWGVTAGVLLGDNFSVQARIENFDRDDGTDVYRVGMTHYLVGHDIKWHLEYADADSNAPLADLGTLTLGAQFSF